MIIECCAPVFFYSVNVLDAGAHASESVQAPIGNMLKHCIYHYYRVIDTISVWRPDSLRYPYSVWSCFFVFRTIFHHMKSGVDSQMGHKKTSDWLY